MKSKYNSTNSMQTSSGGSDAPGKPGDDATELSGGELLLVAALKICTPCLVAFRSHLIPLMEQYKHVDEPLFWGAHFRRRDLERRSQQQVCKVSRARVPASITSHLCVYVSCHSDVSMVGSTEAGVLFAEFREVESWPLSTYQSSHATRYAVLHRFGSHKFLKNVY